MRIMILTSLFVLASCASTGFPGSGTEPVIEAAVPAPVVEPAPDAAVADPVGPVGPTGPLPAETVEAVEPARSVSESLMLQALISDDIRTNSVAVMGVLSGARQYCNLNWRNGFITFIQSLAESGEDVGAASDTHGIYSGVALQNLKKANYQCTAQDVASLQTITP